MFSARHFSLQSHAVPNLPKPPPFGAAPERGIDGGIKIAYTTYVSHYKFIFFSLIGLPLNAFALNGNPLFVKYYNLLQKIKYPPVFLHKNAMI